MDWKCSLGSAGNTENPALFLLREDGYDLAVVAEGERCLYIASRDGRRFVGNSCVELLGLVNLWKYFGDDCLDRFRQLPDVLVEIPREEESEPKA